MASPIVTWLLVIAGWIIVGRRERIRLRRQEIKADIENIYKYIQSIQEDCSTYWHAHGTDECQKTLASRIKAHLQRTSLLVTRLDAQIRKIKNTPNKLSDHMKSLRKQCTSAPFESRCERNSEPEPSRVNEIDEAATELMEEIDGVFFATFN